MSFDTQEDNRAFAKKFQFKYPLLCDVDRTIGIAYGAATGTSTVHAQRVGVVVGPDGRIKEWLPKVDPKTYPHDVLRRI